MEDVSGGYFREDEGRGTVTEKFYGEKGVTVPNVYEDPERFYQNEKTIVDDMRRTLWPLKKNPAKAEHPKRWTGSSDLSVDIEEADRLYGAEIEANLGVGLLEYYRTEYRKMNWQIHSGIAGFGIYRLKTLKPIPKLLADRG
jgi:hypothetical protein